MKEPRLKKVDPRTEGVTFHARRPHRAELERVPERIEDYQKERRERLLLIAAKLEAEAKAKGVECKLTRPK